MKQRIIPYFFGILTSALILGGFLVGRASAAPSTATGCFPDTNDHWAETFICWLKDNSITIGFADGTYKPENGVTRAEMSVFLQKIFNLADASSQSKANTAEANAKAYADSLVNTPPNSGDFVITAGPSVWTTGLNASSPYLDRYLHTVWLKTTAVPSDFTYQADIAVPTVIYGQFTQLKGMRLCYTVGAEAYINTVVLRAHHATNGLGTGYSEVNDQTDRLAGESTCRTYTIATPVNFEVGDYVSVGVVVHFNQLAGYVQISSTSLILSSTNSTAPSLP
ncbi:MAG: S-layer homology domain-containing protein [Anaerolineales bacterium]|nr:S-layer homology domain-containing protein [Anaerolineales bacterium]